MSWRSVLADGEDVYKEVEDSASVDDEDGGEMEGGEFEGHREAMGFTVVVLCVFGANEPGEEVGASDEMMGWSSCP